MSEAAARLVRFDKAKVRKHAEVSVPRPVAEPPFPDAQLAYHNNSKVGLLNAARRAAGVAISRFFDVCAVSLIGHFFIPDYVTLTFIPDCMR